VLVACAVPLALSGGACGGNDEDAGVRAGPAPTARPADFPAGKGMTLQQLRARAPEGPILAPSVSLLEERATNRFGFGLFDRARKHVTGAEVALYTADVKGNGVRGPFVARSESLAVKPQYRSQTTASDPDAPNSVYVADLPFRRQGKQVVLALMRLDGRLVASSPISVEVVPKGKGGPPGVGEKAARIHTPTVADAGGDLSKIDTRVPPAAGLHQVDFADVVGRKPAVLVFATPQLCQSRVCGPVVDIAEQVRARYGEKMSFIHMEIYNDNEVGRGFRPQVGTWRLPSEPWAFAIDRRGVVVERLEGAFSAAELERAASRALSS